MCIFEHFFCTKCPPPDFLNPLKLIQCFHGVNRVYTVQLYTNLCVQMFTAAAGSSGSALYTCTHVSIRYINIKDLKSMINTENKQTGFSNVHQNFAGLESLKHA